MLGVQILLCLVSFAGVGSYWWYFAMEKRRRSLGFPSRHMPKYLKVFLTVSVVGVWFIMPFLPQPVLGDTSGVLVAPDLALAAKGRQFQAALGLPLALCGVCSYVVLMQRNAKATACDYASPAQLITNGAYGYVRHPVIVARFIGTSGIVLVTGATYTAILLPFLAMTLFATAYIEEKAVLEPSFGDIYERYRQDVPAFLAKPVVIVMLVIFTGLTFLSI